MIIEKTLPQGFTVRASTMDDIEALTDLTRLCDMARSGVAETTREDINAWWQFPEFDPATDTRVVCSPEGKLIAYVTVDHDKHARIYTDCEVHPEYRGRGIGTQCLKWAEDRASKHIAMANPGIRVTLNTSSVSTDEATNHLLEQHNFRVVRHFWRMGIELHEVPPAPLWAEGITVRTYTPDMAHAAFEADEQAFRDHWGHMDLDFETWAAWTIKRESFDPSLWFLAMDGDQIAGFAFCRDGKENGGKVGVLGVLRPWRRKGLGLALLYQAFGEFYRRGIHNVSLGVDAESLTGATRLYERAGMHIVRQFNKYEKELRAGKELSTQSVDV